MKLVIILILISSYSLTSFGNTNRKRIAPPYRVVSTEVDTCLKAGSSRITVSIPNIRLEEDDKLYYGYDGTSFITKLKKNQAEFTLPAGKHIFQFYLRTTSNYGEIETDTIEVKEGFNTTIRLNFMRVYTQNNAVRKPVIYLYPEEETQVALAMNIKGTEQFLYPPYRDQWEFTAHPNGDLEFDEGTYNYLFWEANTTDAIQLREEEKGFVVAKDEVVSFLEEKLTLANLSSKEKADFITFWGPLLAQNDLNLVHFIFNEECNRYAEMDINPAPTNTYRIYIVWSAIDESFEVKEQIIQAANREGFYLIEWGGFETTIQQKIAQLTN